METTYLLERREKLGGSLPARVVAAPPLEMPKPDYFAELLKGGISASTTMTFARLLTMFLRHKAVGKRVVPIIPDEARTFGLDTLFREIGIYAHQGQLYEPVDKDSFLYYNETKDGQILEEGITEAGSMSSFVSAIYAIIHHSPGNVLLFSTYYTVLF